MIFLNCLANTREHHFSNQFGIQICAIEKWYTNQWPLLLFKQ